MRIGIEVTAAVRQGGGIGRYVRELLRALAASDTTNNYRLFYASPAPLPHSLPPLPANFHSTCLPFNDIWLARLWHRIRAPLPLELVTGPLDVYHSPDFTLAPTLPGTPKLLTVHDLSFIRDPDSSSPSLRSYLQVVVRRSVQRASHILADSQSTKDDIIELYRTPADRITVLYSGVDPAFQPIRDHAPLAQVRRRYGLGDAPFVFSLSTLQPRKNYRRLIEAFEIALGNTHFRLVLAGSRGWMHEELFDEVRRRHLETRVLFPGFVSDADLPSLYSAAEVMAYPSLYEGFGLPVVEAMACGTPVLASTAPCLPEIAGQAALLVDPYDVHAIADGLTRLTRDEQLRARLVEKGLARAQEYSWQESARKLLTLYSQMAQHV